MTIGLQDWVTARLGPHAILGTRTRVGSCVIEVRAEDGRHFFAKYVALPPKWAAEVRAYQEWTPALGDLAPTLQAHDETQRLILISALPGAHPATEDIAAQRAAGRTLRALHDSCPPRPAPASLLSQMMRRVEVLMNRTPGAFTTEQMAFVRGQMKQLSALPLPPLVPCHGDYRPQNWLVEEAGTARIIDFAEARWQVPSYDLAHLAFSRWWVRPALGEAFLDGYGRPLDDIELEFLRLHLVVNAVRVVAFGEHHGRPRRAAFGRSRLAALMAGRYGGFLERAEKGRLGWRTVVRTARA